MGKGCNGRGIGISTWDGRGCGVGVLGQVFKEKELLEQGYRDWIGAGVSGNVLGRGKGFWAGVFGHWACI